MNLSDKRCETCSLHKEEYLFGRLIKVCYAPSDADHCLPEYAYWQPKNDDKRDNNDSKST